MAVAIVERGKPVLRDPGCTRIHRDGRPGNRTDADLDLEP
jgi:hypothetical protein